MKSVGEIMAIGRTFEEAIQKGLRMVGQGMHGFAGNKIEIPDIDEELVNPTDKRVFAIAEAFDRGYDVDKIHEMTRIDKWFLERLQNIHYLKNELNKYSTITGVSSVLLRKAKQMGFSDYQIGRLTIKDDRLTAHQKMLEVREYRKGLGILPCVKQIDTLAGEYPAMTNYLYVTYNGTENDIQYEHDGRSVIVLGSGAYRIGSSVEFDWCGVSALNTINKMGYRSVMINYNPETVSTDYDTCDRLYFDEALLPDIAKELERSYNIKITIADDALNSVRFYGNFRRREQNIQEIMEILSSTEKMTYTINGKNIVITLPK